MLESEGSSTSLKFAPLVALNFVAATWNERQESAGLATLSFQPHPSHELRAELLCLMKSICAIFAAPENTLA